MENFTLTTPDRTTIVGSVWEAQNPRAFLPWLHGFAEHRARYDHFGSWLAEKGITFAAIDLRGHGESSGKRGFVRTFQDYYQDVDVFLNWGKEKYNSLPAFFGSHSHGGLVSARYLQEKNSPLDFKSIIMTGPFMDTAAPVPAWKTGVAKFVSGLAPGLAIPTDIPPSYLNHDEANCQAYADDPLVFKAATTRWVVEALGSQKVAVAQAAKISLPALVMQGMDDKIVSPQMSRTFYDGLGAGDKHWIGYEGLYHEILNEPAKKLEIYREIESWISKRI